MNTQEQTGLRRGLSRDAIKYIAMFTMLLNHIAQIFMTPGLLQEALIDIGYFTAPVMCWFLVEGYGYTRSKKRYALRLAVFAALSELPFCLAFTWDGVLSYYGMNMIFTLLICFLILLAEEKMRPGLPRRLVQAALALLTAVLPSDWPLLAPVYTLLFAWARGSRRRTKWAFFWAGAALWAMLWLGSVGWLPVWRGLLYACGGTAGMILATVAILYCYNGRRAEHGQRFSKWFFYWFYPVHLLVLGLIRVALQP